MEMKNTVSSLRFREVRQSKDFRGRKLEEKFYYS